MSDPIIRPADPEQDVQGIADMFNESDPCWPGGITEGIPFSADIIREWFEEERLLSVHVAEADGKIVGFCSFMENTPWPSGLYGVGYLDLLNVHPDYHGRSIGRKLLQATIDRSVQEGWTRQTLGTWSANFKSVPAYKRTGHFWRPDTSVWMENFIPGALQMPLAKPFFARHNWYTSYVRKIEQSPDDERWEGLKVYTQHWEADGESLTIRIDREALAPCAIETDEVLVAAIAQELEPLQGSTTTIRWRIHNKRAHPLHAHIHALGADGLEIDHREGFVVPPGLSVEHVAQVKVTDKAPKAKLDGSAPAVRSIVTLDHDEVELFAGMRARAPLSLSTEPEQMTLAPNRPTTVSLALHSELDLSVEGTLQLTAPKNLDLDWRERRFRLEPKGYLRLPLIVQPTEAGVCSLHVQLAPEGDVMDPLKEDVTLFCLEAGSVLGHLAGDSARLESDAVRVTVEARNGAIGLHHKEGEESLLDVQPFIGPPYFPGDFDENHFDLHLEHRDGQPVVRMSAEPKFQSDTRLEIVVGLHANGLVTIDKQLENRGTKPFTGQVLLATDWQNRNSAMITTPLQEGYVHAPGGLYPRHGEDAPRDPGAYAEPWAAIEQRGMAAGVAWNPDVDRVAHSYQLWLHSGDLSLAPGERSRVMRYALWGGSGDWRTARERLLHWVGVSARGRETPEPEARPLVQARLERPVLATIDDAVTADLIVDSASVRRYDGVATVELDQALAASPAQVPLEKVHRDNPVRASVTLPAPDSIAAYQGRVQLDLPPIMGTAPFTVLRLGHRRDVAINEGQEEGQAVWHIDNGATQLTVAPGFGPSATSWVWQGQEMLESSFPQPRGYAWSYPWYGGIQPSLRTSGDQETCGLLVNDSFAVESVTVPDAQDLPWQGVRLSTQPERKEVRDLLVSFDYLTLGDSPVLKLIYRLQNLRPTRQQVRIGGTVAVHLGATLEQLTLEGQKMRHVSSLWGDSQPQNEWGLLTEPQSGRSVLAACPQGRLALINSGLSGRLFGLAGQETIEGDAVREITLYLVLAHSPETARVFRALVEL